MTADPDTFDRERGHIGRNVACILCELRETKPTPKRARVERIVAEVERLADEQRAGWLVDVGRLAPIEAELLVVWRRVESDFARQQQAALLQALLTPKV